MAEIISGIYKITNTVTGDFYIGSSNDVKQRWVNHKCPSRWKQHPNNPMYIDMKKYGVDKFEFQVIAEVEAEQLKEKEQQIIETLKPTYNKCNAKGLNVDKYKEYQKDYQKDYQKSNKGKESRRKAHNKYYNQLCSYNGETLTLRALIMRFRKAGLSNPTAEAKKYLIEGSND